jgi:phage shock protein A
MVLRIKAHATLDAAEDPQQVMEYAFLHQQELLKKVKQGLLDVATSKQVLGQQANRLRTQVPRLEEQARQALNAGREDLARTALERKQTALTELDALDRQLAEVAAEEQKLMLVQRQLAARIEEFRTRRDATSARYAAAQAQVRVSEALTGVSGELAELGMAVGRAEEKIDRMQARASAIQALIDSDALTTPLDSGDLVDRELRSITVRQAVDDELRRMMEREPVALPTRSEP